MSAWDAGYAACVLDPPPDKEFARESALDEYQLGFSLGKREGALDVEEVRIAAFDEGWSEGAASARTTTAVTPPITIKHPDMLRVEFLEKRLKIATERNSRLTDELRLARARDSDRELDVLEARDAAQMCAVEKCIADARTPSV